MPTHESAGFEPTGKLGELSAWHWGPFKKADGADGPPTATWRIDSVDGADMSRDRVEELAADCFARVSAACGLRTPHAVAGGPVDIPISVVKEAHWPAFRKNSRILGLGWFPNPHSPTEGQIVLNGSYAYGDGGTLKQALEDDEYETAKTIVFQYVLLHEIGHAIGLPHATTACPTCVMAPVYNATPGWNGTFTGEDLSRLRALYGPPPPQAS